MRKTIVSIGLIAAMSICFTACGGDTNAPVSEEAAATVAMTEPTTEMATEETTTEAIEDTSSIREKDGVKLSGNLLYATDQASLGDLSSVLAAQLKEVGFEITPVGKEQMVYFQDISNGDFDLAIAITNAIPSDPYLLISRCLTNTVIDNYLAQGLAGMENADELINSLSRIQMQPL